MSLLSEIKRLKELKKQISTPPPADKKKQNPETSENNLPRNDPQEPEGPNQKREKIEPETEQKKQKQSLLIQIKQDEPLGIGNAQKDQQIKTKQKGEQTSPKQLFRDMIFWFPIYNAGLSETRATLMRKNLQMLGAEVYNNQEMEDHLDELGSEQIFYIDYILVDQHIPRQNVESLELVETERVVYDEILNVEYVQECMKKGRLINHTKFILPQKSRELEQYYKHVKQQQEEENGQNCKHRYPRKILPGVGIETVENQIEESNKFMKPIQERSLNKYIIQSFQKMSELYEKKDRGRCFAYGRIASVLKTVKVQIGSEDDVDRLHGMRFIGPKTIQKIKEFVRKGSIERLTVMEGKEENRSCRELEKIWGIGKIRAEELYSRGIKSVQMLREEVEKGEITLTKNQSIGLKYYEELNMRIPRDKVTRMFEFVKKTLYQIAGSDQLHKVEVCGSYRRKRPDCGDMDVIITRKDGTFEKNFVDELVKELEIKGFLTDHLAKPRHIDPKSCISYMGICHFQGEGHHRVDIKYYPLDQYAYAILYFTGSDMFNRNMRLYAMKSGYCLSDHGMNKAIKVTGGKIIPEGQPIICLTEQEIFAKLGLVFKLPQERSV